MHPVLIYSKFKTSPRNLPSYVMRRRKAGFGMPIRSVLGCRDKLAELLDLEYLARIAPFNVPHIHHAIEQHIAGHEDNSAIIFALISFEAWYREFFDRSHETLGLPRQQGTRG